MQQLKDRVAFVTDFAISRGRTPDMPRLSGIMHPEEVAEAEMFVLSRPLTHRILKIVLRPIIETSRG